MAQIKTKFITDSAVTTAKIANTAVDATKLASNAVTSAKIAADAVQGTHIRLDNNQYLRARNNANSADIDILRVNGSDKISFASVPQVGTDASAANDLVRKSQLDALLEGLKPKEAVRAASTANVVIASALENGDSLDGVTLATGDRVLLKDQTAPEENGIYIVAASGAASRSTDFDSTTPINEIEGAYVAVQEGTVNEAILYVQTGIVTDLGTDPIVFVYFNSAISYTGGDGITITGVDITVDHDGQGLTFSAGQLALELDSSTLSKSASGVKVADAGITGTQLNTSVAGNGLAGGGGSALSVNVDDSTIEINTDSLRVKDLGIITAKLAATSVTAAKLGSDVAGNGLTGGNGSAVAALSDTTGGSNLSRSVNVSTNGLAVKIDDESIKEGASQRLKGTLSQTVRRILDGTDITNQYVDLGQSARTANIMLAADGVVQSKDADFTVDLTGGVAGVTRITFFNDLATGGASELVAGDELVIGYEYFPS